MNESLITSIKRLLLREDGGVSADPVAANSAGGGQVGGIGIGPRGEPGGRRHRRRKREAFKTPADRRLYSYRALISTKNANRPRL